MQIKRAYGSVNRGGFHLSKRFVFKLFVLQYSSHFFVSLPIPERVFLRRSAARGCPNNPFSRRSVLFKRYIIATRTFTHIHICETLECFYSWWVSLVFFSFFDPSSPASFRGYLLAIFRYPRIFRYNSCGSIGLTRPYAGHVALTAATM